MEDPPQFGPDEKASPTEFSRLARELLRELAAQDPKVAARLRRAGFDPDDGEGPI